MMPLPDDLGTLHALDRDHLHVFVVGPGRGEGIAIALPRSGWVLLDGATSADRKSCLVATVEKWRASTDEPVELCVLSHPHDDHIDGFVEMLPALKPQRIALAGCDGAPKYVDILTNASSPSNTDDLQKASKVRAAFAAIRLWEDQTTRRAEGIHRSATAVFSKDRVAIEVLSPPDDALKSYLDACVTTPTKVKSEANRYSIVLRVTFGTTTVVLPGDLPATVGGVSVTPGWNELVTYATNLHDHTMMKVAHHGSAEAFHASAMTSGPPDRAWVVTPFNSAKLPRVADADGLPQLVAARQEVLLTAMPASKSAQSATQMPGFVKLADLKSSAARRPGGGVPTTVTAPTKGPLDCVWCIKLNDKGDVVARYRGVAALAVRGR